MRPLCLMLLCALPAMAQPKLPDDALSGRWRMEEKRLLIEFQKGADGAWSGVVVGAEHAVDAGKTVFRGLMFQPSEGTFKGQIVMPEDGSSHDVVLTAGVDTLKAVAGRFIFSRTLELKRQR